MINRIFKHSSSLVTSLLLAISFSAGTNVHAENIEAANTIHSDSIRLISSRPVTSVYNFEVGSTSILDTYLSPVRYHGYSLALSGQWSKAVPFDPIRYTMQFEGGAKYSSSLNPNKTAYLYAFNLNFNWGMNRRWNFPEGWQIATGAAAGFDAGVLYLPRNSNNPASARASIDLALRFYASKKFQFANFPVILSDQITIPSLSLFFSPQYGEPYYEIYLGNHSGLARCGWWGNHFGIDNIISLKLDFGRTALNLGYRFNVASSFVSDINTQIITHSFVIGVIPHGLGLHKKSPSNKTLTINALY